ncbi:MAG: PEP-CTERM sorting domain-containing protein [Akkermansiaceae bacterium]|nr:PEP-CTERM sorting domain-containing protein [Akkermansiaceae bacterium]
MPSPDPIGSVGRNTNANLFAGSYYGGGPGLGPVFSLLLHDDFYTPSSAPGVSTSNDFANWLNTKYADGANAGDYVFIRVDAEGTTSGAAAYFIASADNTTLQKPTLTYTVTAIPEPSALALLGLSCLVLTRRRRK